MVRAGGALSGTLPGMDESPYPVEVLDEEDDDGTMPGNVAELAAAVVGRRIVAAEKVETALPYARSDRRLQLTLDDGRRVLLRDTDDCCAYTFLDEFMLHVDRVEHAITGVGTTGGYTVWHIYADAGDVLSLDVGWSAGNPFYYGYGFDITVEEAS